MRKAEIYYKDDLAGYLTETDDGEYLFQYTPAYVKRYPGQFLTFSMPVREQPYKDTSLFPFFEGLIPEGWLLDIASKNWKLNPNDRMGLLLACCENCIGAVKVGKAISMYAENTMLDLLNFYELSIFCFLTGNNDMYLKNFSMITRNGTWNLAPAYDLLNVTIVNPGDKEELALTLNARKSKFNRARFFEFSQDLGLTARQIDGVFKRLERNKDKAMELVGNSFLSEKYKKKYITVLNERYDRIND